jgi:uncharacterized protein YjbI with pentapeptide repeats
MLNENGPRRIWQRELDEKLKQLAHHRADSSAPIPSFSKIHFFGVDVPFGTDFTGVDLSDSVFEEAKLRDCKFERTDLRRTRFARLERCKFVNCSDMGLAVEVAIECEFSSCKFRDTRKTGSRFRRCKFSYSTFYDLGLVGVQFIDTEFSCVKFTSDVKLRIADFGGARLSDCTIETDMTDCKNFTLDRTNIEKARFQWKSKDPWSQLIWNYTGANMATNLILLAAFFTPLVVKGLGLIALARLEARLATRASALAMESTSEIGSVAGKNADLCLMVKCKVVPVWHILLGMDQSPWLFAVGCTLLIYNGLRAFLTWRIAPLKAEQVITGRSPSYWPRFPGFSSSEPGKELADTIDAVWGAYAPLWWIHRVISILFYFAVAVALWKLVEVFRTDVMLPA